MQQFQKVTAVISYNVIPIFVNSAAQLYEKMSISACFNITAVIGGARQYSDHRRIDIKHAPPNFDRSAGTLRIEILRVKFCST